MYLISVNNTGDGDITTPAHRLDCLHRQYLNLLPVTCTNNNLLPIRSLAFQSSLLISMSSNVLVGSLNVRNVCDRCASKGLKTNIGEPQEVTSFAVHNEEIIVDGKDFLVSKVCENRVT